MVSEVDWPHLQWMEIMDDGNIALHPTRGNQVKLELEIGPNDEIMTVTICGLCTSHYIDYVREDNIRSLFIEAKANYQEAPKHSATDVDSNQYLNPTEKRSDGDILLQLIIDEQVEVFKSGSNDLCYLIAPKLNAGGKQQLLLSSDEFEVYARAIFARDYEVIKPLLEIRESIAVIKRRLKLAENRSEIDNLESDRAVFEQGLWRLAQEYRASKGHHPALYEEVLAVSSIKNVREQLKTLATSTRTLHLRSFAEPGAWSTQEYPRNLAT